MTVVVTRLYENRDVATAAMRDLNEAGFPQNLIDVIAAQDVASARTEMAAARVPRSSATVYAPELTGERMLLVVRAPFSPIGAARQAMEIVDAHPSLKVGVREENYHIQEQPDPTYITSVLKGGPRYFSSDCGPGKTRSRVSLLFGAPLLIRNSGGRSVIPKGRPIFPFAILRGLGRRNSALKGGGRLTGFIPLLARRWRQ